MAHHLFLYSAISYTFKWLWKNQKKNNIFCAMRKLYEIQISVFIKYYWDTAMLVHLHGVCGYFHTTTAELSSCIRGHMAHKV